MPREPYHEIGELLRSHKPDPQPSPGLETRIVQSLRTPKPATTGRIWPWFLLPPTVAAGFVLMWPQPRPQLEVTRHALPPAAANGVPGRLENNPLERESQALRKDARRASRFLIDCLPGLTAPVK